MDSPHPKSCSTSGKRGDELFPESSHPWIGYIMWVGQEAIITFVHYTNCSENIMWLVSLFYRAHILSTATLEYYPLRVREGFFFFHCLEGKTEVYHRWLSQQNPTTSGEVVQCPTAALIYQGAPTAALCSSQACLLAVSCASTSHPNLCIFSCNVFLYPPSPYLSTTNPWAITLAPPDSPLDSHCTAPQQIWTSVLSFITWICHMDCTWVLQSMPAHTDRAKLSTLGIFPKHTM